MSGRVFRNSCLVKCNTRKYESLPSPPTQSSHEEYILHWLVFLTDPKVSPTAIPVLCEHTTSQSLSLTFYTNKSPASAPIYVASYSPTSTTIS